MKQKHNVSVEGLGIEISTGTLAGLASGAVTIRMGETELFVSATAASSLRPGQDFFPLTVDYREKFTAAVNSQVATSSVKANPPKRKSSLLDFAIVRFARSSQRAS